jgi:hypothetical protein
MSQDLINQSKMFIETLEAKIIQISKYAYDLNNPNKLADFILQIPYEIVKELFRKTKSIIQLEGGEDVPKLRYVAFLMLYYHYNYHSDRIIYEDADGNVEDIEMNVGFISMKNYWTSIAYSGGDQIVFMV